MQVFMLICCLLTITATPTFASIDKYVNDMEFGACWLSEYNCVDDVFIDACLTNDDEFRPQEHCADHMRNPTYGACISKKYQCHNMPGTLCRQSNEPTYFDAGEDCTSLRTYVRVFFWGILWDIIRHLIIIPLTLFEFFVTGGGHAFTHSVYQSILKFFNTFVFINDTCHMYSHSLSLFLTTLTCKYSPSL